MGTRIVRYGGATVIFLLATSTALLVGAAPGDVVYAKPYGPLGTCPAGAGDCRAEVYDLFQRLWPTSDHLDLYELNCWVRRKDRNKDGTILDDTHDEVSAGFDVDGDGVLTAGVWVKETLWRCSACLATTGGGGGGLTDAEFRDHVLGGGTVINIDVIQEVDGAEGAVQCVPLDKRGLAATARRNDLNAITQAKWAVDRDAQWRIRAVRPDPLTNFNKMSIHRQELVTDTPAQFRADVNAGQVVAGAWWIVE